MKSIRGLLVDSSVSCGDNHTVQVSDRSLLCRTAGGPWSSIEFAGDVTSVFAASSISFALLKDGSLVSVGQENPLLLRSNLSLVGCVNLPALSTMACAIHHCIAVSIDGYRLYVWGRGEFGALGTGGRLGVHTPVEIQIDHHPRDGSPPMKQIILQVACGSRHSLALTESGDVYSWGSGSSGRLGLGSGSDYLTPCRIDSLGYSASHAIVQIAAGSSHSAALTEEGIVFTWGSGHFGRLGHGDESDVYTPKIVSALAPKVSFVDSRKWRCSFVSCGDFHTASIMVDMIQPNRTWLYTWGDCSHGQLTGNGNEPKRLLPTLVDRTFLGELVFVSCGLSMTTVVSRDRDLKYTVVFGTGFDTFESTGISSPLSVGEYSTYQARLSRFALLASEWSDPISSIDAGDSFSMVVSEQGKVLGFGDNSYGQLGSGVDAKFSPRPIAIAGTFYNPVDRIVKVACGARHCIALDIVGNAFGWGDNRLGQVGIGSPLEIVSYPTRILKDLRILSIGCGDQHSGAIAELPSQDRVLYMWGSGENGRLGLGNDTINIQNSPVNVELYYFDLDGYGYPLDPVQIALGSSHSLVYCTDPNFGNKARVLACGDNVSAQLGITSSGMRPVYEFCALETFNSDIYSKSLIAETDEPSIIIPVGISVKKDANLVLMSNGEVFAWGRMYFPTIDSQETVFHRVPKVIPGFLVSSVDQLACGDGFTFLFGQQVSTINKGNKISRALWTFGNNEFGRLGIEITDQTASQRYVGPVKVAGEWSLNSNSIISVVCGVQHALALSSDRRVYSWGLMDKGRLGQGHSFLDFHRLEHPELPTEIKKFHRPPLKQGDDTQVGVLRGLAMPSAIDPNSALSTVLKHKENLEKLKINGVRIDEAYAMNVSELYSQWCKMMKCRELVGKKIQEKIRTTHRRQDNSFWDHKTNRQAAWDDQTNAILAQDLKLLYLHPCWLVDAAECDNRLLAEESVSESEDRDRSEINCIEESEGENKSRVLTIRERIFKRMQSRQGTEVSTKRHGKSHEFDGNSPATDQILAITEDQRVDNVRRAALSLWNIAIPTDRRKLQVFSKIWLLRAYESDAASFTVEGFPEPNALDDFRSNDHRTGFQIETLLSTFSKYIPQSLLDVWKTPLELLVNSPIIRSFSDTVHIAFNSSSTVEIGSAGARRKARTVRYYSLLQEHVGILIDEIGWLVVLICRHYKLHQRHFMSSSDLKYSDQAYAKSMHGGLAHAVFLKDILKSASTEEFAEFSSDVDLFMVGSFVVLSLLPTSHLQTIHILTEDDKASIAQLSSHSQVLKQLEEELAALALCSRLRFLQTMIKQSQVDKFFTSVNKELMNDVFSNPTRLQLFLSDNLFTHMKLINLDRDGDYFPDDSNPEHKVFQLEDLHLLPFCRVNRLYEFNPTSKLERLENNDVHFYRIPSPEFVLGQDWNTVQLCTRCNMFYSRDVIHTDWMEKTDITEREYLFTISSWQVVVLFNVLPEAHSTADIKYVSSVIQKCLGSLEQALINHFGLQDASKSLDFDMLYAMKDLKSKMATLFSSAEKLEESRKSGAVSEDMPIQPMDNDTTPLVDISRVGKLYTVAHVKGLGVRDMINSLWSAIKLAIKEEEKWEVRESVRQELVSDSTKLSQKAHSHIFRMVQDMNNEWCKVE